MSGIQYLIDRRIPLRRLLTASDAIGIWCSCKTRFSSPQILIFPAEQQKKSNHQSLVGVFLPARLFSSRPHPPLRAKPFPAIEGNSVFSLYFQASSSPNPFRKPRNKGFSGSAALPLSGRGGRMCFRGDFSGRFFGSFRSFSERFPKLF